MTNPKKTPHAETMRKNSILRAVLCGVLSIVQHDYLTVREISAEPAVAAQLKELKLAKSNVGLQLKNLARNKLIDQKAEGNFWVYRGNASTRSPAAVSEGIKTPAEKKRYKRQEFKEVPAIQSLLSSKHLGVNAPADLKVDIIKSTGRVRIEHKGTIIDIGVIDG